MFRAGVPWQSGEEWRQVELFFRSSQKVIGDTPRLAATARVIVSLLACVDDKLEKLCRQSCPACHDPCCGRATVWYDFRDLLFFFWLQGRLPARQISRSRQKGCSHFGAHGCLLPRVERPFLCTWYLCPPQLESIRSCPGHSRFGTLETELNDIKRQRRELERLFLQRVSPC